MKRGLQWTAILLAGMLLLSGCKGGNEQGTASFDYNEYLKEQQEQKEQQAQIWMYGGEYDDLKSYVSAYNLSHELKVNVVQYEESEYDFSQFQTKLQAAIMNGKGPDLVLTYNPDLFLDVNKAIAAGAFQSFDEMIEKWDKDSYYPQIIEASRYTDGHVYLLPLAVDGEMIVTTEENMAKHGLTVEDFADFEKTTETLLALWERYEPEQSAFANRGMPRLTAAIPSLLDYQARKTSLSTPQTQKLMDKYRQINAYQKQWNMCWNNVFEIDGEYVVSSAWCDYRQILDGEQVLEFDFYTSANSGNVGITGGGYGIRCTEEELDRIVCLPMYNTEQEWVAQVRCYALFPAHSEHQETVESLLHSMLFEPGICSFSGIGLSKMQTKDLFLDRPGYNEADTASGKDGLTKLRDVNCLMKNPISLHIRSQAQEEFEARLRKALADGEEDLSKLEKQLNIYLSE